MALGGAGYLLNASAVRLIQAFWLHTWGFVTSMLYEDVCVSMVLQAGDADFHWLKHLLISVLPVSASRKWMMASGRSPTAFGPT